MEAGTGGQEPRGVNAGERGSTHRRKGVKPRCRDPQGDAQDLGPLYEIENGDIFILFVYLCNKGKKQLKRKVTQMPINSIMDK